MAAKPTDEVSSASNPLQTPLLCANIVQPTSRISVGAEHLAVNRGEVSREHDESKKKTRGKPLVFFLRLGNSFEHLWIYLK